jgi:hypothetical protein
MYFSFPIHTIVKEIYQIRIETEICEGCGNVNCIDMHIQREYVRIFWIPFIPGKKYGYSLCSTCNKTVYHFQMQGSLLDQYRLNKSKAFTPLWMYIGITILILGLFSMPLFDHLKHKKSSKLIYNLQVGDVLEVKIYQREFSLAKVIATNNDYVYINWSNYAVFEEYKLYTLEDKSFSETIDSLPKTDLKKMFDDGKIIDINRE